MPTNKNVKAPVQRSFSHQVDNASGANAKDGELTGGADLAAAVAAETTAKVAAIMEEKMSMFSNKLDIITAKLESESQRIEEKGRIRLDRCHRGLGRPKPGVPRVVVMKLHYPADKMKILAVGAKQKLEYEGSRISIRQDIPQNVLQQRRRFNEVCQKLISKHIRFRMQYPATLRFTYNGKDFSFDTAEEAAHIIGAMDAAP
ncbi:uncharacterized protein LOC120433173 [Xyrichtys novacula]|uniref:Uncharacterized protein LOC120433173 n=1 Tax=Xyrichtys novacula TaxID=13765 RepID=A0AAV1GGX6_XYRNO|nr:uncharacterized protein LOC120433173 [Xyrichtys novacula]